MRPISFLVAAAAVTVSGAGVASAPAALKGPRVIVVYGEPLRERVVLHGPLTSRFMAAAGYAAVQASPPPPPAPDRPSLRLALFWQPAALDPFFSLFGDSAAVVRVNPERAEMHGQFFPARGREPALVVLQYWDGVRSRVVLADGLKLLAERGVPTRLPIP